MKDNEEKTRDEMIKELRSMLEPTIRFFLSDIELAFFNYDSDGSESQPGEHEKLCEKWELFKDYLMENKMVHENAKEMHEALTSKLFGGAASEGVTCDDNKEFFKGTLCPECGHHESRALQEIENIARPCIGLRCRIHFCTKCECKYRLSSDIMKIYPSLERSEDEVES